MKLYWQLLLQDCVTILNVKWLWLVIALPSKKEQQLSWDHVNKVITYLVEKEGISADRFIFKYGQEGGDCDTVDLRGAAEGEEGPNTVAPPHPNLRKK